MYQIDNSSVAPLQPASTPAGTVGFFTDGNPATGTPSTIVPAEYLNMLMLEVLNVLSASGITPSKSNFTQLATAIRSVNKQAVILADTGVAGAYTAVNAPALTALPATGYSQWISIAHANPGASTYAPDGLAAKPIYGQGLAGLQGGELPIGIVQLRYLVQAGVNGGNGAWIISEAFGGALQVPAAAQSQHAMQLGQAVGRLINVQVFAANGTFTYTPTIGAKSIVVEAQGGGASAGGVSAPAAGQAAASAGGMSGAYGKSWFQISALTSTVTVTVAAGGAAPAAGANIGNNGGTTSFGTYMTAPGGVGSVGVTAVAPPGIGANSGIGAGPTGANITGSPGQSGQNGVTITSGIGWSGSGGASVYGAGGNSRVAANSGQSGAGYGAGGSGALQVASGAALAGGAGGIGILIIWEYS